MAPGTDEQDDPRGADLVREKAPEEKPPPVEEKPEPPVEEAASEPPVGTGRAE